MLATPFREPAENNFRCPTTKPQCTSGWVIMNGPLRCWSRQLRINLCGESSFRSIRSLTCCAQASVSGSYLRAWICSLESGTETPRSTVAADDVEDHFEDELPGVR